MSSENAVGRWPFETDGPPRWGGPCEPADDGAIVAILTAAAAAADTDPLSLPTLNDRIDPDALDPLLSGFRQDPTDGVRVAIEVTIGGVAVLLRDDGRVRVYDEGLEPNALDPSTVVEHDWRDGEPLHRSIDRAVAAASSERRIDVTRRLLERIDVEAANKLLRPLRDGSGRRDSRLYLSVDGVEVTVEPDGTVAGEPSIAVLERSGAALLVVGSVPEGGFDRTAATLLGEPDANRSPLFALHGRDLETARRRLSMAGVSPDTGVVLDHRTTVRGAATGAVPEGRAGNRDTEGRAGAQDPEVVPVEGGVADFVAAVDEAIDDTDPDGPWICVDSLRSMIDSHGVEPTHTGIEPLCRTVRDRHGVGVFVLPVSPDGETVERLAPLFDGIVELRTGDVGVEQRWRLTGPGHETAWFPAG